MRFRSTPPPPPEDEDDDLDYLNLNDEDEEEVKATSTPSRRESAGRTLPPPPAPTAGAPVAEAADAASIPAVPAGTLQGMTALQKRAFRSLTILFGLTALIVALVTIRLGQRGQWLPEMPGDIGAWSAADMPLTRSSLQLLGMPPSRGRRYSNLFGEKTEAHVIATATFEAYTEPKIVMAGYGYALTAEKRLPLFDKYGGVRALVLRNDNEGSRILMYYWIQYTDGTTQTRGSLRSYSDLFPRFRLGVNAVMDPKQSVIVRAYTQVHPADRDGLQARRNMNEIARAIHQELLKQGRGTTAASDSKGDAR
jgi:hypothetical protein